MKSTNDDYTDDYDAFEAYKRIYIDGKGVPKECLEKYYNKGLFGGYGNLLMGKA